MSRLALVLLLCGCCTGPGPRRLISTRVPVDGGRPVVVDAGFVDARRDLDASTVDVDADAEPLDAEADAGLFDAELLDADLPDAEPPDAGIDGDPSGPDR